MNRIYLSLALACAMGPQWGLMCPVAAATCANGWPAELSVNAIPSAGVVTVQGGCEVRPMVLADVAAYGSVDITKIRVQYSHFTHIAANVSEAYPRLREFEAWRAPHLSVPDSVPAFAYLKELNFYNTEGPFLQIPTPSQLLAANFLQKFRLDPVQVPVVPYELLAGKPNLEVEIHAGTIMSYEDCMARNGTWWNTNFLYPFCVSCPFGTRCVAGIPALCVRGEYQDEAGQTGCKLCPAGTFGDRFGLERADDCVPCPAGTARAAEGGAGRGSCAACPAGRYASTTGLRECRACPRGTFKASLGGDSVSACQACPAGTTTPSEGAEDSSSCTPCPAGTAGTGGSCFACAPGLGPSSDRTTCVPCAEGTFGTNGTCSACPSGAVAPQAGATGCSSCPSGSVPRGDGVNCDQCPPGSFFNATLKSCEPCSNGTVAATAGQVACSSCPPGTVPRGDAVHCDECPRGSFYNAQNRTCALCPPGTLGVVSGALSETDGCSACPVHTYNEDWGRTSCESCPDGTEAPVRASAASACTACPLGQRGVGQGRGCEACPVGTAGAGCTVCPSGRVALEAGMTACVPCPDGSEEVGGACSLCAPGFWGVGGECARCPAGFVAPGTGQTECQVCARGTRPSENGTSCSTDSCDLEGYACYPGLAVAVPVSAEEEEEQQQQGGETFVQPASRAKAEELLPTVTAQQILPWVYTLGSLLGVCLLVWLAYVLWTPKSKQLDFIFKRTHMVQDRFPMLSVKTRLGAGCTGVALTVAAVVILVRVQDFLGTNRFVVEGSDLLTRFNASEFRPAVWVWEVRVAGYAACNREAVARTQVQWTGESGWDRVAPPADVRGTDTSSCSWVWSFGPAGIPADGGLTMTFPEPVGGLWMNVSGSGAVPGTVSEAKLRVRGGEGDGGFPREVVWVMGATPASFTDEGRGAERTGVLLERTQLDVRRESRVAGGADAGTELRASLRRGGIVATTQIRERQTWTDYATALFALLVSFVSMAQSLFPGLEVAFRALRRRQRGELAEHERDVSTFAPLAERLEEVKRLPPASERKLRRQSRGFAVGNPMVPRVVSTWGGRDADDPVPQQQSAVAV